jgi:DNA-binding beta-propeller fold protein YncE
MRPAGSILAAIVSAIPPVVAAAAGAVLLGGCASCQSTVRTAAMPVIAAGAFDGVEVDRSSHRLYLADRTTQGVDVVDISSATPRFVSTIPVGGSPSGLAVAADRHRLYAGLGDGTVAVIDTDPASAKAMSRINTITADTSGADLIDYSAQSHTLFVGAGAQVLAVDLNTNQVTKRLTTGAPVEQPRFDPADGMVYVTTPGNDTLLQMNPVTGMVTRSYVIKKCHPAGLGINPSRQLALLGCGSSVALLNLRSGAQQVTRAVEGGDVVTYDAAADRFVIASPHDTGGSSVGVFYGDGSFIGSVASSPNAHAAAFDSSHGVVYAPGPAGLMSFAPEACAPPPDWLKFLGGLSIFAVPMLAFGLFLVLYARRRQTRRDEPAGPTLRELQEQDMEMERERMRSLEDGILGPEG